MNKTQRTITAKQLKQVTDSTKTFLSITLKYEVSKIQDTTDWIGIWSNIVFVLAWKKKEILTAEKFLCNIYVNSGPSIQPDVKENKYAVMLQDKNPAVISTEYLKFFTLQGVLQKHFQWPETLFSWQKAGTCRNSKCACRRGLIWCCSSRSLFMVCTLKGAV